MSSRWIMLFVLATIFTLRAQNSRIGLTFDDLEAFFKEYSPQWKIVQQNLEVEERAKQVDMQWSNPQIGFEIENVSRNGTHQKETTLAIEKNFEMPWIYLKRRQSLTDYLQAAALNGKEQWNVFMAQMRSGYVELALLDDQNQLLKNMKSVLEIISGTAESRYKEGAISGLFLSSGSPSATVLTICFQEPGQILRSKFSDPI